MGLLLAEGHTDARLYPVAAVWNEARYARRRINDKITTEAVLMHATIVQALAGGEHLNTALEKLRNGE